MRKNIDKYRPKLHYSVKKGWLNDPNGLVYLDGKFHMFYQHYPYTKNWGPMHWGHTISTDLFNWEDQEIALYPDQVGTCFSGSAVVDRKNTSGLFDDNKGLVAMYTSAKLPFTHGGVNNQSQSIAYSKDEGKSWEKYKGNPVIENCGVEDFRDPKVIWYEAEGKWIMIIAVQHTIYFYESINLLDWEKISEFGENLAVHEGVWECPDLIKFDVEGKEVWLLKVSVQGGNPSGGTGEFYFTGIFNGKEFIEFKTNNYKWIDSGRDIYASQSWFNTGDRKLLLGWMTNLKYADILPMGDDWRGIMNIPRELNLINTNNEYILIQEPVKEIEKLRKDKSKFTNIEILGFKEFELIGETCEIVIDFELLGDSKELNFKLLNSLLEYAELNFDIKREKGQFRRDKANFEKIEKQFNLIQNFDYKLKKENQIRIILDRCCLEIYINGGEKLVSNLIFPTEIFSKLIIEVKGKIKINRLNMYKY